MNNPLITQLGLEPDLLENETVIVTGAGGGIGFEAARAMLGLGANVVIAEINTRSGTQAAETLATEFKAERVLFVPTDVGDHISVKHLYQESVARFGRVDVVINNATIAVLGQVIELPIEDWDRSYRVNLRGPVLMAKTFLPDMIQRNHGIFVCVSSTGTAYLGGYETFKAAQVHLATTLDAELEGTDVITFTIGPGLVPTETASRAVSKLAPRMGMSVEEFFHRNRNAVLSAEEAGTGFALSVIYAEKFRGQEISSIQALKAVDINFGSVEVEEIPSGINSEHRRKAIPLCQQVYQTLREQSEGWNKRSLFERQWVIRDFKKTAGMPVEEWLHALQDLLGDLGEDGSISAPPLERLAGYYEHLAELAKGYEKDAAKLAGNLVFIYSWRDEVVGLRKLLERPTV